MKNQKKIYIICIIVVSGLVITALSVFFASKMYHRKVFSSVEMTANHKNRVKFNPDVLCIENGKEIQKNFDDVEKEGKRYILKYKKEVPQIFSSMKQNDIFCVYPDKKAGQSFFQMGFCGKYISSYEKNNVFYVEFSIPSIKEVFSDIYLSTEEGEKGTISSSFFFPSDNVAVEMQPDNRKLKYATGKPALLFATAIQDAVLIGDTEVGFTYQKASQKSIAKDYILLCDKLKLNIKNKAKSDLCDIALQGSVTLDQPAVKMVLDYHYDKKKDQIKVNDYSIGLMTKHKIDLSIKGEKEIGLDDFNADLSDIVQIIDIEDTTKSEKGKIVLGTYLIGMEAALPILNSDVNQVNYLSLGIAIQLTLTAKGTLSLEYCVDTSGFLQIETDAEGKCSHIAREYDYPHPAVDINQPTEQQQQSKPEIVSKAKGEASLDVGCGLDIGICILGMIPMKLSTNAVEMEMTRSFQESSEKEAKAQEIYREQYLLDDNVDSMIISNNSSIKMNLGAKVKLGPLKYQMGKAGGSVLLYKEVLFQYPNPIGFSHSQCGFGGVYAGEKYSDDELKNAYRQYADAMGIHTIINGAKDTLVNTAVNGVLSGVCKDLYEISQYISKQNENYKLDYFSPGILYVRDENNVVIGEFITADKISNIAGFHPGISYKKTEEVYSTPKESYRAEIKIGWIIRKLFGLNQVEDMDVTYNSYQSSDSAEQMELLYQGDELKLIIITHGAK